MWKEPLTFWWQVYVYIFQAVHKLSEGSITAKDLCEKCIKRLEKTRQLNAFITETFESSRNVAVEIDRKRKKQKSNFTLTSICNHTQWWCVLIHTIHMLCSSHFSLWGTCIVITMHLSSSLNIVIFFFEISWTIWTICGRSGY